MIIFQGEYTKIPIKNPTQVDVHIIHLNISDKNNLNELADAQNWTGLTKKINGGTHGLDDRIARTDNAMSALA